jgi:hypothetical protein
MFDLHISANLNVCSHESPNPLHLQRSQHKTLLKCLPSPWNSHSTYQAQLDDMYLARALRIFIAQSFSAQGGFGQQCLVRAHFPSSGMNEVLFSLSLFL